VHLSGRPVGWARDERQPLLASPARLTGHKRHDRCYPAPRTEYSSEIGGITSGPIRILGPRYATSLLSEFTHAEAIAGCDSPSQVSFLALRMMTAVAAVHRRLNLAWSTVGASGHRCARGAPLRGNFLFLRKLRARGNDTFSDLVSRRKRDAVCAWRPMRVEPPWFGTLVRTRLLWITRHVRARADATTGC